MLKNWLSVSSRIGNGNGGIGIEQAASGRGKYGRARRRAG